MSGNEDDKSFLKRVWERFTLFRNTHPNGWKLIKWLLLPTACAFIAVLCGGIAAIATAAAASTANALMTAGTLVAELSMPASLAFTSLVFSLLSIVINCVVDLARVFIHAWCGNVNPDETDELILTPSESDVEDGCEVATLARPNRQTSMAAVMERLGKAEVINSPRRLAPILEDDSPLTPHARVSADSESSSTPQHGNSPRL